MKNLNTLFLAASSLLLLVGCGPKEQKEVKQLTASEFNERLTKIEKHVYKSATVHAIGSIVGTDDFEMNRNEDRTEKYKYYPETDAWLSDESVALLRRYIFNFDSLNSLKSWVEASGFSYTYKYYSDLSIEITEKGTFNDRYDNYTEIIEVDSEMTIKLNEFGFISELNGTYTNDITQTYTDFTKHGTKSGVNKISVTFEENK